MSEANGSQDGGPTRASTIFCIVALCGFGVVSGVYNLSENWFWPALVVVVGIGSGIDWLGRKAGWQRIATAGSDKSGTVDTQQKLPRPKRTTETKKHPKLHGLMFGTMALVLTSGLGSEIVSGAAFERTGGPTYRAVHPWWYWFDIAYQMAIIAAVAWLGYRAWRSR